LAGCWRVVGNPVFVTKGGHMTKLVIGLAAFVLLAAGGALAGGAITDSSSDDGIRTGTTTNDVTTLGTTTNDTTTAATTTAATTTGVDISGPCDEAEHANDPRCTGVAPAVTRDDNGDDDRRDRGRGRDDVGADDHGGRGRGDEDGNDDRSGSNSGRG
jgi:hypothetical protein